MSIIIKDYWKFNKKNELIPYRLGQIIDLITESIFLKKVPEREFDYEYIGSEEFLWMVTVVENQITRLVYKNNSPFPSIKFWDADYKLIKLNLEKTSYLVGENDDVSKMCVISRDYFVFLIIFTLGIE